MHEGNRSQRRLARITKISEPGRVLTQWMSVLGRQLHEEIVWMLAIDQRLAFVRFTGLK